MWRTLVLESGGMENFQEYPLGSSLYKNIKNAKCDQMGNIA